MMEGMTDLTSTRFWTMECSECFSNDKTKRKRRRRHRRRNDAILPTNNDQDTLATISNSDLATNATAMKLISKWLPYEDLGSCRLVCRTWYNVLIDAHADREKFCIGSQYFADEAHVNQVCKTLASSTRSHFHLELYGLHLGQIRHFNFWRLCAPNIVSLKLIDCVVKTHAYAKLLSRCTRLECLEINVRDLRNLREGFHIKVPSKHIPTNLKNESVRTLKIHFKTDWRDRLPFWLHLLQKLFYTLPNLTTFSFCQFNVHFYGQITGPSRKLHYFRDLVFKTWNENEAREAFFEYFARDQMDSIALKFLIYEPFLYSSLRHVDKINKITEIAVDWDVEIDMATFMNFAQKQENLQKVTCATKISMELAKVDVFVRNILKLSSLRELQLFLHRSCINWQLKWSLLLVDSNIESLRIVCREISFVPDVYPLDTKLTTLAIRTRGFPNPNIAHLLTFLKSLSNLRDLCLSHVDNTVLRYICSNYQDELQSLTLGNTRGICSNGIMQQLKNLKRLEVPNTVPLDNIRFEHLKNLRIVHIPHVGRDLIDHQMLQTSRKRSFSMRDFQRCRTVSSSVETLWIDYFKFETTEFEFSPIHGSMTVTQWFVNTVLRFVSELRNLKLLYFEYEGTTTRKCHIQLSESDVFRIFQQCPSLRTFVFREVYVRDVITKSVRKCPGKVNDREFSQRYLKINEEFEVQYRWAKLM